MPRFFAMTSTGLVEALEDELQELGFERRSFKRAHGGVSFETNWEGCYKANLNLRTASRVLLPVLEFPAYEGDDLYHNIRKHDWTKYIDVNQTLAVDASVRDGKMHDQRYVALKVKDAVVDQFREKFDVRPDVNSKNPDLRIIVKGFENRFMVSVDTSGEALFKRGYREEMVPAPLKETVAAALIRITGWEKNIPIVDPMCGSGTFLIEAAQMALGRAPGIERTRFAFQGFKGFQKDRWESVAQEALDQEKEDIPFKFYGFDVDRKAVRAARINAEMGGVSDFVEIEKSNVDILEPPCEEGIIIVNPPYGERLGVDEDLKDDYRNLAYALKERFQGWTCWMLSGNPELSQLMGMKSSQKYKVYNGPIECRFIKYEIKKRNW